MRSAAALWVLIAACGEPPSSSDAALDARSVDTSPPDAARCGPSYVDTWIGLRRTSTGPLSWTSAEADCESDGGHLVTIGSASEQTSLDDLTVWIGLTEIAGVWQWIDGAPVTVTAWASGYPAGAGVCVRHGPWGWVNEDCARLHAYLCECEPQVDTQGNLAEALGNPH